MTYKNWINEKFTEDSDPISDMGIGMEAQIKKFVKEQEQGYEYNLNTALWICAKKGKLDFVNYLLDKGANVHIWDDYALQMASVNGHTKIVELLLKYGADVHGGNDYSLRWASHNGHIKIVKLLLDAGADVHAYNGEALRWAGYNGHTDVVQLLKKYY